MDFTQKVRGVVTGIVAVIFALVIGKYVVSMPAIALALTVVPLGIILLFKRPVLIFLLYLVAVYDGCGILPLDSLLAIPGLFKGTDIFLMALLAYVVASTVFRAEYTQRLAKNNYYKPILLYTCYTVFILFYTVIYWHEELVYAFRAGRNYFSYGLPLIIYSVLRTRQDWKRVEQLCLVLICGVFFVNIADAAFSIEWIPNIRPGSSGDFGIYKAYTEIKALNLFFLARYLWVYAHSPSRKSFAMLALVSLPFSFYFFRGFMAGVFVGLFVMICFMRPAARSRSLLLIGIGGSLGLIAAIGAASIISGDSVSVMFQQFFEGYLGDVLKMGSSLSGETGDYDNTLSYRMMAARDRLPLVRQHILFGIGYLSPWGKVAWGLYQKGAMPLGDVDSGWLDVLIRLGGVGAIALSAFYVLMMKKIGSQFRRFRRLGTLSLVDQSWMMGTLVLMIQILVGLISGAYVTALGWVCLFSIGIVRCMKIWEVQTKLAGEQRSEGQGSAVGAQALALRAHRPGVSGPMSVAGRGR